MENQKRLMTYLRRQATRQNADKLYKFAKFGSVDQVRQWLTQPLSCKHGQVRVRNIQSALQIAVINNRIDIVNELLTAYKQLVIKLIPNIVRKLSLNPLLMIVAQSGAGKIITLLLNAGAMVQYEKENSITPLQIAAKYNNLDCVSVLLEAGADPNRGVDSIFHCDEHYPIQLTTSEDIARLLIHHGSRVCKKWEYLRGTVDVIPCYGRTYNICGGNSYDIYFHNYIFRHKPADKVPVGTRVQILRSHNCSIYRPKRWYTGTVIGYVSEVPKRCSSIHIIKYDNAPNIDYEIWNHDLNKYSFRIL